MDDIESDFASSVDAKIAKNVKLARERAELSQSELAAHLTDAGVAGMHQTTIARIESGQRVLRLAEALALARFFEYQLEDWVESSTSANLRSQSSYLRKGVIALEDAATELNFRRWSAAEFLDSQFRYTPGGRDLTVLEVDPRAFDGLDELLTSNSDPLQKIVALNWKWLDNARKSLDIKPFVSGWAMGLYEEALLNADGISVVNYFSGYPDEDFETEVLARR